MAPNSQLALMPEGDYAGRITEISEPIESRNGYPFCKVSVEILGAGHTSQWLISTAPNAEWVWKGYISTFGERHKLLDRVLLFRIRHDAWHDVIRERLTALEELSA